MRPIVVTAGSTSNTATAVTTAQTSSGATQIAVDGSLATKTYQGTGAISGNVLTISATVSGSVYAGMPLSGLGMSPNTVVLAPGQTAGTWIVSPSQTFSSATVYGGTVASLVTAQRVGIVSSSSSDNSKTVTVIGTTFGGLPATETVTLANAGTVNTATDFLTVTQVYTSASTVGTISLRTVASAGSPWVRFDDWAQGDISVQCVVTGTANYTVQITGDDPNSPTNAVAAASVTWSTSAVANAATASFGPTPLGCHPAFARILLNSGSGSVTGTFLQGGVVPY